MFRSSTLRPLHTVMLSKKQGLSASGREQFAKAVPIGVSIVHLRQSFTATSVRTDQSGSKGRAEETLSDGRLMVDARHPVALGDLIEFDGISYRISSKHPRYAMDGRLHHTEVDLTIWVSASPG